MIWTAPGGWKVEAIVLEVVGRNPGDIAHQRQGTYLRVSQYGIVISQIRWGRTEEQHSAAWAEVARYVNLEGLTMR